MTMNIYLSPVRGTFQDVCFRRKILRSRSLHHCCHQASSSSSASCGSWRRAGWCAGSRSSDSAPVKCEPGVRPEWENYLPHNETQLSSHLTTDGAEHLSQQSRHFALFEGQVSLAVEDAEDDVAEAGLSDAAAHRLRPLAPAEVNEMQS